MTLQNTRFGTLDYETTDVIDIPGGLIGFPDTTEFLILSTSSESPFRWLQSIDSPALAFLVTDPVNYVRGYEPELSAEIAEQLHLSEESPRLVFTTVSIPSGRPDDMTINLAGPIVVNADTRQGKQVVLEGDAYTTKHRVFQKPDKLSGKVAA